MQQYGEQPVPPPTRPLPDLPDEPIPMPPPGDPPAERAERRTPPGMHR
jgi:hypothetical protein